MAAINACQKHDYSATVLDLRKFGREFTRPTCRAAAVAIDRYLLRARARLQQQIRRPPLLSTEPKNMPGGTDVLGKCKSVPGNIRIRASIFTSVSMLFYINIPFKLIVSDAL